MNIDRHNYEEYFILYWDDELTNEQKQLVKQFVMQNPDLEGEFNLLGQSRFTPDETILMPNKEFLVKEEYISRQELFLSYIDDELSESEKSAVDRFIAIDPPAARELALLQKAKLPPDKTVFPYKSTLYRREAKLSKMVWFRVAVAASIILAGSLIGVQLFNTKTYTGQQPFTAIQKSGQNNFFTGRGKNSLVKKVDEITKKQSEYEKNDVKKNEIKAPENQTAFVRPEKRNRPAVQKVDDKQSLVSSGNLPETDFPRLRTNNNTLANTEPGKSNDIFINNIVTPKTTPAFNNQNSNNGVQFASNNEDPSGKGGLRGLLRKATRVFERRTNIQTTTEDNKLLVGAFAVSLK